MLVLATGVGYWYNAGPLHVVRAILSHHNGMGCCVDTTMRENIVRLGVAVCCWDGTSAMLSTVWLARPHMTIAMHRVGIT